MQIRSYITRLLSSPRIAAAVWMAVLIVTSQARADQLHKQLQDIDDRLGCTGSQQQVVAYCSIPKVRALVFEQSTLLEMTESVESVSFNEDRVVAGVTYTAGHEIRLDNLFTRMLQLQYLDARRSRCDEACLLDAMEVRTAAMREFLGVRGGDNKVEVGEVAILERKNAKLREDREAAISEAKVIYAKEWQLTQKATADTGLAFRFIRQYRRPDERMLYGGCRRKDEKCLPGLEQDIAGLREIQSAAIADAERRARAELKARRDKQRRLEAERLEEESERLEEERERARLAAAAEEERIRAEEARAKSARRAKARPATAEAVAAVMPEMTAPTGIFKLSYGESKKAGDGFEIHVTPGSDLDFYGIRDGDRIKAVFYDVGTHALVARSRGEIARLLHRGPLGAEYHIELIDQSGIIRFKTIKVTDWYSKHIEQYRKGKRTPYDRTAPPPDFGPQDPNDISSRCRAQVQLVEEDLAPNTGGVSMKWAQADTCSKIIFYPLKHHTFYRLPLNLIDRFGDFELRPY